MANKINYGFQLPVITPDQWTLGAGQFGGVPLRENGQWDDFLPVYEPQAEKYETYGCTVWGGQNQIETLFKYIWGIEPNYAERFNYILVGIRPPGTDPHKAYESFRNDGLIEHLLLPVPNTYNEFLMPDPMEKGFLVEGQKWLRQYEFKHDWVLQGKYNENILKEALKFCPVAISVSAWFGNEPYEDKGIENNHWCLLYGWTDKGWKVFDSYDHSKKIVSFKHNIRFAKRISLRLRPPEVTLFPWTTRILRLLILFFKSIWK